ncbi:MAG: DUF167 domain-containing protein [Chloroflexota bacterium]
MARAMRFTNGKKGAALPVRVIPRASRNEIVEVLNDQTVKIRLIAQPAESQTNEELISFLAKVLGMPPTNFEIVAGINGRDKLVSILDVSSEDVHKKILENLS